MLVATSILLFLFLVISSIRAQSTGFQPIFNHDEAIRHAKSKEVLKFMNLTVRPCDDFYEFACGNWDKYHATLKEHEVATPDKQLNKKINTDLQHIIEEQVTLDDGVTGLKVKEFYKSCIDAERNGIPQQSFFSEFIKTNGGFPAVPGSNWLVHHHNYNWQEVIGQLRFRYGMNILIGLDIDINPLNTHENSIYLSEPSTLIPAELCGIDDTKRVDIRERAYESIEKDVAENLKMWLTISLPDAKKIAADIVTFEFELCTAMKEPVNYTSLHSNYARKTLIDFSHDFNDSIDFNQFVSTSFGIPIYKLVFMKSAGYFRQLIKTVNNNNKTTIANYIMYRALSTFSFPVDDHPNKRPNYCLHILKQYFPKVIGDMYQRKNVSFAAKNEIEIIFDKLKDSFENSLRSSWIEESTSRVGRKKLSEIVLSFPIYEKIHLNNLQLYRNNYWNNLAQIMAQLRDVQLSRIYATDGLPTDEIEAYDNILKYRPTHKRIDMSWGLLQSPYYQQFFPNSMRYATIGHKLAQELATAFNDLSWSADPLGLSNWDHLTAQIYQNRTECFRQQLSNYLYNTPHYFQNATSLRELIAKSSGLNIAFNAYLDLLEFLNPNNDYTTLVKETLPELNFTNTQLFFITYAQMHCRATKKPMPAPTFSTLQGHTMERYEVNGPLRNFVEFAREFSCSAGAEMNPVDKCAIY